MDNEKSISRKFCLVSQKCIVLIQQSPITEMIFIFSLKYVDCKIIHKINLGYHLSILSDI